MMMEETKKYSETFVLEPNSELRLATTPGGLKFKLVRGTAEVFGSELVLHRNYGVQEQNYQAAIHTFHGCQIEVEADTIPSTKYVEKETPMNFYINLHAAADSVRHAARLSSQEKKPRSPVTLVVGSDSSGKTTLCRIMLNYAVRAQSCPIFVDLDLDNNTLGPAGSIAVAKAGPAPADPTRSAVIYGSPVQSWFVGDTSTKGVAEVFRNSVLEMGNLVARGLEHNKGSGCIIDAGQEMSTDMIQHVCKAFGVTILLVVANQRIARELQDAKIAGVEKVVDVPSSGGVQLRDASNRGSFRHNAIKQYFYGVCGTLQPHIQVLRWDQVTLMRVENTGPAAPIHALPIGTKSRLIRDRFTKLNKLDAKIVNHLAAVGYAGTDSSPQTARAMGFVVVKAVDLVNGTITVLTPCAGPLPSLWLFYGSVQFIE